MSPRPLISDRLRTLLFGLTEGVLLAALVVNIRDAVREDAFFSNISVEAVGGAQSAEDRVVALVHKTHEMVVALQQGIAAGVVADASGLAHYRRILFGSAVQDAIYPTSVCGSFAGLLVELLKAQGFSVRFGQMLDRDDPNGIAHHIVVEVWLDGRWVICDPMYDLVFRGQDGRILGFEDIHRDWDRVKSQCPPDYDMHYDYRGFRRVNFGMLNSWLQKTPLANLGIRAWLNEGAWLRSALVAGLMALVLSIHVWVERSETRLRMNGPTKTRSSARGTPVPGTVDPKPSAALPARGTHGVAADR